LLRTASSGDIPFGTTYVSLRNEAFVRVEPAWREKMNLSPGDTDIYPPNEAGYNGASHLDWLSSSKKKKKKGERKLQAAGAK